MNPIQLVDYFDRITDAPDSIPRLRRFVLDLAVRGKLVAQDGRDEPASELLKQIQIEKERLAKTTGFKQEALPPIEPTEVPFDVPGSWAWMRLGWGFQYDAGTKREPRELVPDRWLLELEDIEKDSSVVHMRLKVQDRDSRSTKSEFREGDILYGKLRPYLNKVVVANEAGYSTTEIVAIRPFVPLSSSYCCLALRSSDFVAYVSRVGQGTKMPRLRTQDALVALFPLPPLAEQQRIVAKLDELMALCDRLEDAQCERELRRDRLTAAALHNLDNGANAAAFRENVRFYLDHMSRLTARPEHVQQFRQTALSLAVRGHLLPQDPQAEPVDALLSRNDQARHAIAEKDRRANSSRQVLLAAEDRWDIPPSWNWSSLADLVLFIDYRGKTPTKTEKGVRLITAKNVKKAFINSSPEEFLSERDYHTWMTRGFPKEGDILFTTEAPMGNAAVVRLSERFALAQRLICFRPYHAVNSDFLTVQLLAEPFQSILGKTATGLTAKGIKAAKLRRLPVAVPPIAEQLRIVAKVNELTQLCDRLEAQLSTAQNDTRSLLEAVLHDVLATPALSMCSSALINPLTEPKISSVARHRP